VDRPRGRRRRRVSGAVPARRWMGRGGCQSQGRLGRGRGRGRSTVRSPWMKRTVQIHGWQNEKRQATLRALISSIDYYGKYSRLPYSLTEKIMSHRLKQLLQPVHDLN
jgi:hypothetical protein